MRRTDQNIEFTLKRRYLVVSGWDGKMDGHYMLIKRTL